MQYFIFDEAPLVQGSFGLKVFGSAGDTVFDSSLRPMRVLGRYNGSAAPWPYAGSVDYTETAYPFSHGDLAVVTCQQAARMVVEAYDMMGSYIYETFINSSRSFIRGSEAVVINSQETAFAGGGTGGEMFRRDLWEILVVDVSGYPSEYSI